MKRIYFLVCLALVTSSFAKEEVYPLQPTDISSPRATLKSFIKSCEDAYVLLKEEGRDSGEKETILKIKKVTRNILHCMDLSEIPSFRRENTGKEAAASLKEILDRIELPNDDDIPNLKDMTNKDGSLKEFWIIPHTEITFKLITKGSLKGKYQFSPNTITHAKDFLQQVSHLPYKEGATEGLATSYLTQPGQKWLANIIKKLPESMKERKNGQTVWQWIGIGIVIIVMTIIMGIIYSTGRRMARGGAAGGVTKYVFALIFPILAIFAPLKTIDIVSNTLVISGTTLYILKFNLSLLVLFCSMIVVLGIGRRVGEVIVTSPSIKSQSIDAQLIRISSRLLGFIFAMALLLQGGKHLGIPLSSLLAGAGVAGMALALSAQDVLKNVFGSIMLIMDKPFIVGERIKIKNYDGFVEEIGLRSTKIRLLNGHQASIPNEYMARSDIENIGRRPFIRRSSSIQLPIDIGSAKAKQAVEIVQEILKDHEGFKPQFPPRIWLNDFKRDHLELKMIYWYHPPDYWKFTVYTDRVNRQIIDAFEAAEIEIALPAFHTHIDDSTKTPLLLSEKPKPKTKKGK